MTTGKPIQSEASHPLGLGLNLNVKHEMQKREIELKGLNMSIVLTVKDKNEGVVEKKELPANSFLLNFMKMLYAVLRASTYTIVNTGGSSTTIKLAKIMKTETYKVEYKETTRTRYLAGFHAWALKEDDSHGIMVGSGTKLIDPNDYALDLKIPHGLGENQLIYLSGEVKETTVIGNQAHLKIRRSFINHSGSSVYVREVGLAVKQFSPEAVFLIIRDVIAETEVPNDYTLDVEYLLFITV
ncbi:MAG: hypothetical protein ACXQTI_06590 [Candidatus Nezhaarchaeales archaeon]